MVAAVTAAAAATMIAVGSMGDRAGPVVCPFRLCTGTYCPGCGGSRAAAALVRGDFAGAWHHHPYTVLLAVQLLVVAGVATRRGGRAWLGRRWVALVLAHTALVVGIWALRLGLGDIPGAFR